MQEFLTIPFFTGLAFAILLPFVGNLLRLRSEWLATLGLAHMAAASSLVSLAINIPAVIGAQIGAIFGAVIKNIVKSQGDSAFALMILAGWSGTLLIAANSTLGESLAHAIIDGQLYFANQQQLILAVILLIFGLAFFRKITPRLISARLFPENESANNLHSWRWHFTFDLCCAIIIATATTTIGLMASFTLIFVPAFFSFRVAKSWHHAEIIAILFSLSGYILSFFLAVKFDQPFAPILTMISIALLAVMIIFRYFISLLRIRKNL